MGGSPTWELHILLLLLLLLKQHCQQGHERRSLQCLGQALLIAKLGHSCCPLAITPTGAGPQWHEICCPANTAASEHHGWHSK